MTTERPTTPSTPSPQEAIILRQWYHLLRWFKVFTVIMITCAVLVTATLILVLYLLIHNPPAFALHEASPSFPPTLSHPDSALSYVILPDSSGEHLESSLGELVPLKRGAIRGHLDALSKQEDIVELIGWAADTEAGILPKAIIVFVNNNSVYIGTTGVSRPDVAKLFNNSTLHTAGFKYELPSTLVSGNIHLRVIGISASNVGSDLVYDAGAPWTTTN